MPASTQMCTEVSQAITDENGSYICRGGSLINSRYEVTSDDPVRETHGAVVVEAFDAETQRLVAIKLINCGSKFKTRAEQELRIFETLGGVSETNDGHIITLLESFNWKGHKCLVFERLSHSLGNVVKSSLNKGIKLGIVRSIAKQLLPTLKLLEIAGVVHADLKLENVLLCNPPTSGACKVVNFGHSLSTPDDIFLRQKVDVWSLGCMLVELVTGVSLFPNEASPRASYHHSGSHVVLLETFRVFACTSFDPNCKGRQRVTGCGLKDGECLRFDLDLHSPESETRSAVSGLASRMKALSRDPNYSREQWRLFSDFIVKLLEFRPEERLDPQAALEHPFLDDCLWTS